MPPMTDQTMGNACPDTLTTKNAGRWMSRASHVPTKAPRNPSSTEMTNPPPVPQAMARAIAPQTPAITK